MKKLIGNGFVKAAAVTLFTLSVLTFVLSAVSIGALSDFDAYKRAADFEKRRDEFYSTCAREYAYGIARWYAQENGEYDEDVKLHYGHVYYEYAKNADGINFEYLLRDGDDHLYATLPSDNRRDYCYENSYEVSFYYGDKQVAELVLPWNPLGDNPEINEAMKDYGADWYEIRSYAALEQETDSTDMAVVLLFKKCYLEYQVDIWLYADPQITDDFAIGHDLLETGYNLRYTVIVLCVLSFILSIGLFVFLMFAAGRRRNRDGTVLNFIDRLPYDLFTLISGLLVLSGIYTAFEGLYLRNDNLTLTILICSASAILSMLLLTLWFMSTAARFKHGKWWKNTLIARLFRGIVCLIRMVPVIWKSVLFLFAVGILDFFALLLVLNHMVFGVVLWVVVWILITAAVIGCSIAFRALSKGAERIAEGSPKAKIDTTLMVFDFKTLGENLNHIDDGIRRAVDEQMKSERLKTELITNVSHDIKTPLTSIINYVDLLEREGAVTEAGIVYLEVLSRQSARLKKLIEDLIQASKASTGNLETHMIDTDSVVLAEQIVGEYSDRLQQAGLEMICHTQTERATILADGQLLYRVFDNLLGNICKYAQPGTRVYLDVTEAAGKISFLFRNISASPLHISPDELTERFVRGDASRNTEGSGLGLSIAKSLTELMGGTFDIEIDGDLFKVILSFDQIG